MAAVEVVDAVELVLFHFGAQLLIDNHVHNVRDDRSCGTLDCCFAANSNCIANFCRVDCVLTVSCMAGARNQRPEATKSCACHEISHYGLQSTAPAT